MYERGGLQPGSVRIELFGQGGQGLSLEDRIVDPQMFFIVGMTASQLKSGTPVEVHTGPVFARALCGRRPGPSQ